tara:strand:- start:154 stop:1134 length:981 start_codon:yes stop_codon:yes gene_type:complete
MIKFFKLFLYNSIFLILIILLIELFLYFFKENHLKYDQELGWKLKENLNISRQETDLYGNSYSVDFKTNNDGVINIGIKNTYEILVIGDSFSADPYVGTDKMWYSVFSENIKKSHNFNTNINVIGAGGYGTFQQYLLLKRLEKKFNPKLVILQFCSNDLENNYYKIEKKIGSINQYARRPYFENEKIYYSDELISRPLRLKYFGQSRVINKIYFLIFNNKKNKKITIEDKENSKKITLNLLKKIRKIYPNTDYYIFNCNNDNFNINFFAKNSDFELINTVRKELNLKKNEEIYFKDNGHYNELGQEIIGMAVFDYFKTKKMSNFFQ